MTKYKTEVTEGVFPLGNPNPVATGLNMRPSYKFPLVNDPEVSAKVENVSFEPGARTKWHKHVGGYQILLVTAGEGWYQQEGEPARILGAGEVAVARNGVKHWHGAAADSWLSHIVVNSGEAVWFDIISDEDYALLEDDWADRHQLGRHPMN